MKSKKFISAIVAAAIMLSMSASSLLQTKTGIAYAVEVPVEVPIGEISSEQVINDEFDDGDGSEETDEGEIPPEESGKLSAPQITVENGFITWDAVEGAYGYNVRAQREDNVVQETYYESPVECNRFFYEQTYEHIEDMDFGEYTFYVCAFDESVNCSEWSNSIVVSYAPTETVKTPKNVKFVDGDNATIVWDEDSNAVRHNIKIYNEDGILCGRASTYYANFWWWGWVNETGNYTIKVQAMDENYNVSAWSEPISGTYTAPSNEAPQNVRLDESGDYVLWDAVEGARSYSVGLMNMYYDSNGSGYGFNRSTVVEAPQCQSEWKFLVSPFSDKRHEIWVSVANEIGTWNESDSITVDFTPDIDETLVIPTEIRLEDNYIVWDEVEGAAAYWTRVSAYGNFFNHERAIGVNKNNLQFGDSFPAGTYEIETAAVGKDGNYNTRVHSFELNTIPDESVWIPKLYYKFDTLVWDWDKLRHENTEHFWLRFSQDGVVVKLEQSYLDKYYKINGLSDGKYTVEICATENGKTGNWSEPFILTKHGDSLFDEKNEVTTEIETAPEAEDIPEEDRITSITINPAFNMKNKNDNNVELDLTKIKIKAKEIYDEEGLQRATEALGETIEGNKHYNLLDLTLLYDEEDFSNGYNGLVQVVIPIPTGHRDKTFTCYRLTEVDGKTVKEVIPGEQTEDSYIIYLEHFSIYAMVGDDEKEHTHDYGDKWESDKTGHWKECECGETSNVEEHTFGEWKTTKEATEEEEGEQTRKCEVCEWTETKTVDKLTPAETSASDTSATETPAPETSDTSTTEPPVSETSDTSTTEPPVPETSDSSTTEPPVPETSDTPTTEPPVPETSDTSTTEPPVPETSDTSTTEPPVPETSDTSTTEPPVSETSDTSTTEPPVPETSDTSTTEPPVPETSDSSTAEPPVPDISDTSTTEPPAPEISETSTIEPPAPGTSDPITDTTVTIVDENTNITVIDESGALKDGAKLKVEDKGIEDGIARYDISIVDENGNEIQPEGGKTVTVRIPVPEGMSAENCKIYRAETNGKYTDMNCKAVTADGIEYLEFTAEHFSEYIVTEKVLDTEPEPTSTTEPAAAIKVPAGSFTVPDTTASAAANTTIPPETTETEPAAASSTSSEAQAAANANTETTSASIPSAYDNMGGNENVGSDNISAPGNVSNTSSNNSGHNTDKNVNTGVLISILPVAAAVVGVIISKKKK